jgi:hypothetical protein
MNKPHPEDPDIMIEYDLTGVEGRPNKFAKHFPSGRNVIAVVLDPDVAERFPDAQSVNKALRALGQMMEVLPLQKPESRTRRRASA